MQRSLSREQTDSTLASLAFFCLKAAKYVFLRVQIIFNTSRQNIYCCGVLFLRARGLFSLFVFLFLASLSLAVPACSPVNPDLNFNVPGQYALSGDINGDCIKISADDVSLNCNNHIITSGGGFASGISVDHVSGTTITNCKATGFPYGILLLSAVGFTITGSEFYSNSIDGIRGVSSSGTVSSNSLHNNPGAGLILSSSTGVTIQGNTISNNGRGIDLEDASNNNIGRSNTLNQNGVGLQFGSSNSNDFSGIFNLNMITGSEYAIIHTSSTGNVITATIVGSTATDLLLQTNSQLKFLDSTFNANNVAIADTSVLTVANDVMLSIVYWPPEQMPTPIQNAQVVILQQQGQQEPVQFFQGLSNALGYIDWMEMLYYQQVAGVSFAQVSKYSYPTIVTAAGYSPVQVAIVPDSRHGQTFSLSPLPGGCIVAEDCPQGQQCIEGACTIVGACVNDGDCQQGQQCVDGICVGAGACASHADCPGGQRCKNGACTSIILACASNIDCASFDYSPSACTSGACAWAIDSPFICSSDANCAAGQKCEAGICRPEDQRCLVDADCQGQICRSNSDYVCYIVPCNNDANCPNPATQDCVLGVCAAGAGGGGACETHADCPGGQRCVRGSCTVITNACESVTDCAQFEDINHCDTLAGVCAWPPPIFQCSSDGFCDGGKKCESGRCQNEVERCLYDSECPAGQVCRESDHICMIVYCNSQFDCPNPAMQQCVGGFCSAIPSRCTYDFECGAGSICVYGQCAPAPAGCPVCEGFTNCDTATLTCKDPCDINIVEDCPPGQFCDGFCSNLYMACDSDNDCPPGVSFCDPGFGWSGACVTLPLKTCASNEDCSGDFGTFCAGNRCMRAQDSCRIDSDCPQGSACVGGLCYETSGEPWPPSFLCQSSADCPGEGQFCNEEISSCQPEGMPCDAFGECPQGAVCVEGICFALPERCSFDFECGKNKFCHNNACEERPENCPECEGQTICDSLTGTCKDPCDINLAGDCPQGQACGGSLCSNVYTACSSDADCSNFEMICDTTFFGQNGACVTQPLRSCTQNADCLSQDAFCVNGRCMLPASHCRIDSDCPQGSACVGGLCFESVSQPPGGQCTTHDNCPLGQFCNLGSFTCQDEGAQCAHSWECPQGSTCDAGVCKRIPIIACSQDADCPAFSFCSVGPGGAVFSPARNEDRVSNGLLFTPVSGSEREDSEFRDASGLLFDRASGSAREGNALGGNGLLFRPAQPDDDVPPQGVCLNAIRCSSDEQCTLEGMPVSSMECRALVDSNGYCWFEEGRCFFGMGCPAGQTCNVLTSTCSPSCESSSDCAQGQVCSSAMGIDGESGRCVPGECSSDVPCPAGEQCNAMFAVCAQTCFADADCPQGLLCMGGSCSESTIPCGNAGWALSPPRENELLLSPANGGVNGEANAFAGEALSFAPPNGGNNGDGEDGGNGEDGEDGGDGEDGEDGWDEDGINGDRDCPEGLSCEVGFFGNSVCVPDPLLNCVDDSDCVPGSYCFFGLCVAGNFCLDDNDCGEGQDCVGNVCAIVAPTDSDGDGIGNAFDNCLNVPNANQLDSDEDGFGNACDNCPVFVNPDQQDSDADGVGDACELQCQNNAGCAAGEQCIQGMCVGDADSDGVIDGSDNCVNVANANQVNSDGDEFGDACDNCPSISNSNQQNSDADTVGDACDNCLFFSNLNQLDSDADEVGDACDNCVQTLNPSQQDSDNDDVGDACEVQCVSSNDCAAGLECVAGECTIACNLPQGVCSLDSPDCGGGQACYWPSSRCEPACSGDSDCAAAQVCSAFGASSFCAELTRACQSDEECSSLGMVCNELIGACTTAELEQCASNSDCPADSICLDGLGICLHRRAMSCCTDSACQSYSGPGSACGSSNVCVTGGSSCSSDRDCGAASGWSSCLNSQCVLYQPKWCVDDSDCGAGQDCVAGACFAIAVADADSDGVADNADNCPAVPNAGQADSNGNGIGDACEGAAGCGQGSNCGAGEECVAGACVDQCFDSDAKNHSVKGTVFGRKVVGEEKKSVEDACVQDGKLEEFYCSAAGENVFAASEQVSCPAGFACSNGACAEAVECNSAFDCATDKKCVNHVCNELVGECGYAQNHEWNQYACCDDSACPTGKVCELTSHTCKQGCNDNGDCALGEECKLNACVKLPAPSTGAGSEQGLVFPGMNLTELIAVHSTLANLNNELSAAQANASGNAEELDRINNARRELSGVYGQILSGNSTGANQLLAKANQSIKKIKEKETTPTEQQKLELFGIDFSKICGANICGASALILLTLFAATIFAGKNKKQE